MKIIVVADDSGRIVGFSHDVPGTGAPATHATALAAGDGQTVHSVELSPELVQRIGDDSFATELFRHAVVKKGRNSVLSRAAPKKRSR